MKCPASQLYGTKMNLAEEAELDRILERVEYTECDEATEQPGPLPELIGAVRTPTKNAVSAGGMALHKGREREMQVGLARGLLSPSPSHVDIVPRPWHLLDTLRIFRIPWA